MNEKKIIMLIDDDIDILFTLTTILKSKNFDTVSFQTFEKSTDYLSSNTPELIISDFNLRGDLNGIEFYIKQVMRKEIPFALHSGTFFPTPNALHTFQEMLPDQYIIYGDETSKETNKTNLYIEVKDTHVKHKLTFFQKPTDLDIILSNFDI